MLVALNARDGRLFFTQDLAEAVRSADAVFIAVGTLSRRGGGFADLSYVQVPAKEIAGVLDGYTVVMTKSTVPVGTGNEVERIMKALLGAARALKWRLLAILKPVPPRRRVGVT